MTTKVEGDALVEFIAEYWLEAVFTVVVSALGWALKKLWRQAEKNKADNLSIKNGMMALLRAEIISTYNHYEERGVLPIYARENFYGLYKEYKTLGGNGAIEDIMAIASEWPTTGKRMNGHETPKEV